MAWIGVDLDGTLAEYRGWPADGSIGKPIPAMVERVKRWLDAGEDVRIFTARVWPIGSADATNLSIIERISQAHDQADRIFRWCEEHLGRRLPVTCVKDYEMIALWDDRAIQVELNTGRPIGDSHGS